MVFTQFSSVPYIGQLIVNNIAQPSSTIESGFCEMTLQLKVMIKFYFEKAAIMLSSSKNSDVGIDASS